MSRDLIIRLPRPGGARVPWSVIDRHSGETVASGLMVGDRPPLEGVTRALYLAPSSDLMSRTLTLPAKRDGEARQAAPFAIEDELAGPLDDTEIAVGPRRPDGSRIVHAADRGLIERWRRIAAAIDVRPAWLLPEAMALEAEAGDLVLADEDNDVVFVNRTGTGPAFGRIEAEPSALLFPALFSRLRPGTVAITPRIRLPGLPAGETPKTIHALPAIDFAVAASRLPDTDLRFLPALLGHRHSAATDWTGLAAPYRRAGVLALTAMVLFLGFNLGEGFYLRSQAASLDARAEAAFRNAFPDVTRVVNLDAQLRQRLASVSGGSGSDFLRLFAGFASLIEGDDAFAVEALRYDSASAALSVSATYPDFASFEALRDRAIEAGLIVEDQGARQDGLSVRGEFRVRLAR
ncbi:MULTISPECIES: type II secretion system protein GspL [Hyphobacterium]|uniref:Type II secretion system protein GspL n=1 Tax=Hyphobacterium vulgare TaxID=1736751 RepID=A0ABV6ZV59_9PROT